MIVDFGRDYFNHFKFNNAVKGNSNAVSESKVDFTIFLGEKGSFHVRCDSYFLKDSVFNLFKLLDVDKRFLFN